MSVAPCEVCGNTDFRRLFVKYDQTHHLCGDCGLIRISPQPTDEELDAIYRVGYFKSWGGEQLFNAMKKKTFNALLNRLPARRLTGRERLLDIGAATGVLMEVAQDRGYDVYGIEASKDGSAVIAEKFGAGRIVNAYFTEHFTEYESGFFDVICLIDLFEHLRRPDRAIRKVYSLLRPGGSLLLYLPDSNSIPRHVLGKYWPYFATEHLFSFSRKSIVRLLRQNGFRICRLGSAAKYLNAEFAANLFIHHYKLPIYKIPAFMLRLLPKKLSNIAWPLPVGQMFVIAQREDRD